MEHGISHLTDRAHAAHSTLTCTRCGGHFAAPGVARKGRIYCCDKCAAGPSVGNMLRMLPVIGALLGAGAALGWLAGRTSQE